MYVSNVAMPPVLFFLDFRISFNCTSKLKSGKACFVNPCVTLEAFRFFKNCQQNKRNVLKGRFIKKNILSMYQQSHQPLITFSEGHISLILPLKCHQDVNGVL